MNDVAKTAADMLRMGVEPSLEVEIELRAENDKLREQRDELLKALAASMQHIATNVVACNGLKCREAVCMSCNGEEDAEVAAKVAFDAYVAAGNLIAKIRGGA